MTLEQGAKVGMATDHGAISCGMDNITKIDNQHLELQVVITAH
jgi:hypothetical protein